MGIFSSAGPDRPDAGRRSIQSTFAAVVAGPAIGLVLLWIAAIVLTFGSSLTGHGLSAQHHRELVEFELLGAAGLIVVVAAVGLTGLFARRISRDVRDLAATARQLADGQTAQIAERLGGGTVVSRAADAPPGRGKKAAEIAAAQVAIARLQRSAAAAAASEAGLRTGLAEVFVSLARRNQSLLQRQLRLIDTLEQKAADPAALADLFSLDHLTTRMRRHAESLAILSGAAPGRAWREPVPVIDVIRAAMAEVEDYRRVTVLTRSQDAVTGTAVADMIHLLAELIENATLFSPSGTQVEVQAGRVANGFAIEIDDRGLGIEPDQLAGINQQLANPPDFDLANADRLGLFVGGKLAARHDVRVVLRASAYGGTTAIVLLPSSIIVPAAVLAVAGGGTPPDTRLPAGRPARLGLRGAEGLTLVEPLRPAAPAAPAAPAPAPAAPAPAPAAPAPADGPAADGAYHGLPRRRRQASLSPHLRDNPLTAVRPPRASPVPGPEEARELAASLQSGWQRGREAGEAQAPEPQAPEPQAPEPQAGEPQAPEPRSEDG